MAIGGMLGGVPDDLVRQGFQAKPQRAPIPRWLIWSSLSLSGLTLGGLVLLVLIQINDQTPGAATAAPSRSAVAFVEDQRLAPMLSFDPPGAGRSAARYRARMRQGGGERSDSLTYGEIGGGDLFFRVAVHTGMSTPSAPSLFVELAKQSAELDAAVIRATSPEILPDAARTRRMGGRHPGGPGWAALLHRLSPGANGAGRTFRPGLRPPRLAD